MKQRQDQRETQEREETLRLTRRRKRKGSILSAIDEAIFVLLLVGWTLFTGYMRDKVYDIPHPREMEVKPVANDANGSGIMSTSVRADEYDFALENRCVGSYFGRDRTFHVVTLIRNHEETWGTKLSIVFSGGMEFVPETLKVDGKLTESRW